MTSTRSFSLSKLSPISKPQDNFHETSILINTCFNKLLQICKIHQLEPQNPQKIDNCPQKLHLYTKCQLLEHMVDNIGNYLGMEQSFFEVYAEMKERYIKMHDMSENLAKQNASLRSQVYFLEQLIRQQSANNNLISLTNPPPLTNNIQQFKQQSYRTLLNLKNNSEKYSRVVPSQVKEVVNKPRLSQLRKKSLPEYCEHGLKPINISRKALKPIISSRDKEKMERMIKHFSRKTQH